MFVLCALALCVVLDAVSPSPATTTTRPPRHHQLAKTHQERAALPLPKLPAFLAQGGGSGQKLATAQKPAAAALLAEVGAALASPPRQVCVSIFL